MPNTLGLDDDLDGVELARDLEESFGVKFSDKEASACQTVGDIFRFLLARLPHQSSKIDRCASAMAFYRLRTAVSARGVALRRTPATRLAKISSVRPKSLFFTF